jgi:hypothetical protein
MIDRVQANQLIWTVLVVGFVFILAVLMHVHAARKRNSSSTIIKGNNVGTININGQIYEGNNVSIVNGVVKIDGVIQKGEHLEKKICEIHVLSGTINQLKTDSSVYCQDVAGDVDAGGSVTVQGSVGGEVDAGGSVKCGAVTGDVDAGGSVTCGSVGGSIDAGGSVRHG